MNISPEARSARKALQEARLAAKQDSDVDYTEFYAKQPLQVAKAAANAEISRCRRNAREAKSRLADAIATGTNIEAAENAAATAIAELSVANAVKAQRFPKGQSEVAAVLESSA
jgi:hypothetical protein